MVALNEGKIVAFNRTESLSVRLGSPGSGGDSSRRRISNSDATSEYNIPLVRGDSLGTRADQIDFLSSPITSRWTSTTSTPRLHGIESAGLPSSEPRIERLAGPAERVIREHFGRRISAILEQLSSRAGQSSAAPLAADLFFLMRDYAQRSPADPLVDVVMALHDALAANDFWADAQSSQFTAAKDIIEKALARNSVTDRSVDAAIGFLEELGFDTTPFSVAE